MAATKLNQILAVEKGIKVRSYSKVTEADKMLQKAPLLTGITRIYEPKDDQGEELPSESTLVQINVVDVLKDVQKQFTDLWDITATKDWSNTFAKANVVLENGDTLIPDVPVPFLLFMEKQLNDLKTLVSRLPILDPQYKWNWDDATNCYSTNEIKTHRTKKNAKVLTKAEATKEHPAQTELLYEDQIVGYWRTTHLSGAITAQRRLEMLEKIEEIQRSFKIAREAANNTDITQIKVADDILNYVFAS